MDFDKLIQKIEKDAEDEKEILSELRDLINEFKAITQTWSRNDQR
jgi:hypothetical protein